MNKLLAPNRVDWSVVIPLYNKQEFIESTLRSVLAQAGDLAFEVIVVDDGSLDRSAERVSALEDARIKLVRQQNSGVSAARNRGIREARGKWVAFLDADDLWSPQALVLLHSLAERFPMAGVLGGSFARVPADEVDRFVFEKRSDIADACLIRDLPRVVLKRGMPFCSSSVAVRRDLLSSMPSLFPVGEAMGEDLDLWFRLGEASPIAYSQEAIAVYRTELANSLMGSYRDPELLPVWHRLAARASAGDMPKQLRSSSRRLAAEMQVTVARKLARVGRKHDAWQHLIAGRAAVLGHRWWLTAIGICLGVRSLIER